MTILVRSDLADSHRLAWEHIAAPGSWWTGVARVELATTALIAITDPDPLAPWIGVSRTDRLPFGRVVPAIAHDVAYRLARHAGTMTEAVYRAVVEEIDPLPYVELCAIVSSVAAVAHFCRNIGAEIPSLPRPLPGVATGERPDRLEQAALNWVPVAAPADEVAAVVQAYTGVPGEQRNTWRMADAQYMPDQEMVDPEWTRRPGGLTRAQMELVATRVAQLRECFY